MQNDNDKMTEIQKNEQINNVLEDMVHLWSSDKKRNKRRKN